MRNAVTGYLGELDTGHGDRPKTAGLDRAFTEMRTRVAAGEPMFPLVAGLHTLLAEQSVPEWRSVVDAVAELDYVGVGPVGYLGMSLGCGLGVPLVAAEPRIRAAVLGLFGALGLAGAAARITVPVQFVMQWDDGERCGTAQAGRRLPGLTAAALT